jgi:hypothetical protein
LPFCESPSPATVGAPVLRKHLPKRGDYVFISLTQGAEGFFVSQMLPPDSGEPLSLSPTSGLAVNPPLHDVVHLEQSAAWARFCAGSGSQRRQVSFHFDRYEPLQACGAIDQVFLNPDRCSSRQFPSGQVFECRIRDVLPQEKSYGKTGQPAKSRTILRLQQAPNV